MAGVRKSVRITELPCELASREILPSIRAAIVRVLVEERGYSKYTVAKMMGLTPASITYYMSGRRGNPDLQKKLLNSDYRRVVEALADIIERAWKQGADIGAYTRYRNLVCTICSGFNPLARAAGCPR